MGNCRLNSTTQSITKMPVTGIWGLSMVFKHMNIKLCAAHIMEMKWCVSVRWWVTLAPIQLWHFDIDPSVKMFPVYYCEYLLKILTPPGKSNLNIHPRVSVVKDLVPVSAECGQRHPIPMAVVPGPREHPSQKKINSRLHFTSMDVSHFDSYNADLL